MSRLHNRTVLGRVGLSYGRARVWALSLTEVEGDGIQGPPNHVRQSRLGREKLSLLPLARRVSSIEEGLQPAHDGFERQSDSSHLGC